MTESLALLKVAHIVSAAVILGTGAGIAFFTWFGYRTLWVNRYQLPFEELGTQPTRTGSTLRGVLPFFA